MGGNVGGLVELGDRCCGNVGGLVERIVGVVCGYAMVNNE